jgi:hypothetical protein
MNHLAKCISSTCSKYANCQRALSENNSEVNYWFYCSPKEDSEGYQWFIPSQEYILTEGVE